jgi:tetratricopeptide (TPR) repeat protein
LLAHGHAASAAESYRRALRSFPAHAETRIKLAHALKLDADFAAAADVLEGLAADFPDDAAVEKEFGRLCFARGQLDDAVDRFDRALRLNPRDADAHHWLANLETLRGNAAAAQTHYRRSVALDPVVRVSAVSSPADFSVLFLFAPGGANTPPDFLVKQARYESCFLLVLAGASYDHRRLRDAASVVVNLISDVDSAREILLEAAALLDRIGLRVINHPRSILRTDRQSVAELLAGIPFCRVPWVRRLEAGACWGKDGSPALVRVAGTHGGESFERIETAAAFSAFAALHPDADLYLTEFVDYQSADGLFRKYRFFFVGEEILPYHLAISDGWKVHHCTTDMANQAWMRDEEAAFLNDPGRVFDAHHFAALEAIRRRIGLEFCGIDCGLDRNGDLVVFEVNATMLVRRPDGMFAYKAPAADRIKRAFDGMLARVVLC